LQIVITKLNDFADIFHGFSMTFHGFPWPGDTAADMRPRAEGIQDQDYWNVVTVHIKPCGRWSFADLLTKLRLDIETIFFNPHTSVHLSAGHV